MATLTHQKALGAFYTTDNVARFLVDWAIRSTADSVLDPSCGDGVFLAAAQERLASLGAQNIDAYGIDYDARVAATTKAAFPSARVIPEDFFSVAPEQLKLFTAVVGNPPFVRYQSFAGTMRDGGLHCAARMGVKLPRLTSSWAPFLVHAAAFVQPGGRLAMVVPAELGHAQYAHEVLRFLAREFGKIKICMFRKKLFPDLSEDTHLLLAEERGAACTWLSVSAFESIEAAISEGGPSIPVDLPSLNAGRIRLSHYLLPLRARSLYQVLAEEEGVVRLSDHVDVGIGYVTGCNEFFHLTVDEIACERIPRRYLRPAVPSLNGHRGTIFRYSDWKQLRKQGEKAYLLALPNSREDTLVAPIRAYLTRGKKEAIHKRFKCRVRVPWYSVPHIREADAFLSYMAGGAPKLVLNPRHLVAPNTLHLVRFVNKRLGRRLVAGWYSSLTRLSCEMEGHALGGGLLKLEPTEAERVVVALAAERDANLLLAELDQTLRVSTPEKAQDIVDEQVLRKMFGRTATECAVLRDAAAFLQDWRLHR